MIEVEIKVKIDNPNFIKNKFEKLNGKYILSLLHEDTYYNMPKRLRDFKQTDEALRIRKSLEYNKNSKEKTSKENYYLTYKGKKIDKTTKTREEIEVKVDNFENTKRIFNLLGFREFFTVKKKRELYEFNYDNSTIELLIDYIPILDQHFLEVELIMELKENLQRATDSLFKFLRHFNITENDSIRESYLELIAKKLNLK